MIVDKAEKIACLQEKMKMQPFYEKIRMNCYYADETNTYMHMKIYSADASVEKMLDCIRVNHGIEKTKTVGLESFSEESTQERGDKLIKQIERCFQPYIWQKDTL